MYIAKKILKIAFYLEIKLYKSHLDCYDYVLRKNLKTTKFYLATNFIKFLHPNFSPSNYPNFITILAIMIGSTAKF